MMTVVNKHGVCGEMWTTLPLAQKEEKKEVDEVEKFYEYATAYGVRRVQL